MKRHDSDLAPELEAFLTPRRIQRELPAGLRARVLAHARAAALGEDAIPRARPPEAPPMALARGRRLFRIALAASFAVAGVAVGAVAVRHGRSAPVSAVASPTPPKLSLAVTDVGDATTEPPPPTPDRVAATTPHAARRGVRSNPFTAELELLQRAHGAYTRHDFSVALTLVAAHARRFPNGQLAEQREALRVRSLTGAGRADEAQRAAATFAVRFPRSVLLSRVSGGAESSQP